jgi:hypothetical protein
VPGKRPGDARDYVMRLCIPSNLDAVCRKTAIITDSNIKVI